MSRVSSMTSHNRLKILKAWVQLPILDSKYSKLEYNLPYSTQHTHSLSTTFHTLLEYEYGIGQILNDESSIEYDFPYSTQNTQSLSMTFHTRLKVLNTQYSTQVWVHVFVFVTSFCGAFCTHTYTCLADRHSARCHYSTHYYRYSLLSLPTGGLLIWAHKVVSPRGSMDRTRIFWTQRRRLTRWSTTRLPLPVAWTSTRTCVGQLVVLFFVLYCFCGRAISKLLP